MNGTVAAREIKVTDTGWADFVFGEDYRLRTLESLESFIKEKKHLPDVPSAEDIQKEGIEVSAMLAKQMQKIEELTLYLIEIKKENQALKSLQHENETLQKENQNLKADLETRIAAIEKVLSIHN